MSIFLKRNKFWAKVSGQIKVIPDSSVYFSCTNEWYDLVTYIQFPIEKNETLESLFMQYASYDLNAKKINKIKIIATQNVKQIQEFTVSK